MSAQDYAQISTGIKSTITGCINWRDRAEVDFWMQHKTVILRTRYCIPSLSPRGRCSKAVLMTPGMSTSTGVDCERHLNVNYFTELT